MRLASGKVLLERTGTTWIVTLNRPEVQNALDSDAMDQLEHIMDRLEADGTGVVILTGKGKAFCAGGDLLAFAADDPAAGTALTSPMRALLRRLENLAMPVIAAINGYAFGGGLELALAADLRLVATSAEVAFRQGRMGLVTGWGGARRLVEAVGQARALELLLTGRSLRGRDAVKVGLAAAAWPAGELLSRAEALATEISANSAGSLAGLKYLVRQAARLGTDEYEKREAELFAALWTQPDHTEAVRAFKERR